MKKLFLVTTIILISFFCSGCAKKYILFNTKPFTQDTLHYHDITFKTGTRIYYIYLSEKPIKSRFLRVQIGRVASNATRGGYTIVFADDYRLTEDQVHFYTNYVVLHSPGRYVMQVFARDELLKPLCAAEFYVKN